MCYESAFIISVLCEIVTKNVKTQRKKRLTTNRVSLNKQFGGSDEDRTRYLLHAMEALSQVSYGPITAPYHYTLKDFLDNNIFYNFII